MLMTGVRSLYAGDGSWAQLSDDATTVTQGGPRRLWDRVETLAGVWQQLGSPHTDRYGVTVSSGGRKVFWLDTPATALPEPIQPPAGRPRVPQGGRAVRVRGGRRRRPEGGRGDRRHPCRVPRRCTVP